MTYAYRPYATGRTSRKLVHPAGAPDGFRRACQAVSPVSSLAGPNGSLSGVEVKPGIGEAVLTLHCGVQHVHVDLVCDLERISVDAVGPTLAIPLMPHFLDGLTIELADDIQRASKADPARALQLATTARLTRGILDVVGRGARLEPVAVQRLWQGAVSEVQIQLLGDCLRTAYAKAGRSPVRQAWLTLSPVIVVGAVLANAYQEPMWLLRSLVASIPNPPMVMQVVAVTGAEAVTVFPTVLFVWIVASLAGRRRLRGGVGDLARRGPPQGKWPLLGMLFALALGWTALASRLDASPMGLPWAPATRPGGRSLGEAVGLLFGKERVVEPGKPTIFPQNYAPAARAEPERAHRP